MRPRLQMLLFDAVSPAATGVHAAATKETARLTVTRFRMGVRSWSAALHPLSHDRMQTPRSIALAVIVAGAS